MSSYPYIGKLAPAVGGGLGGLPRRKSVADNANTGTFKIMPSPGQQTVTVPANTAIKVKVWGAGGASGWLYTNTDISSLSNVSPGGAGGYAEAVLYFSTATDLIVCVGYGGERKISATAGATFLAGGTSSSGGAQGGGYSGIFLASGGITQASALVIAGGGGGGADSSARLQLGGGGGESGNGTGTGQGGGGGTQSAGGLPSQYSGTAGSALTGGDSWINAGRGGGGGGYFGGGAGNIGGGGGGSGFVATVLKSRSFTLMGAGNSAIPPNILDAVYFSGIGLGGYSGQPSSNNYSGGSGAIVMEYA